MQRILIICEGQTEQEFCNNLLKPYFWNKNKLIQTPLIKKSGGGIVPWRDLKSQIEKHLLQEKNAYITTFIDYFGLGDSFPAWKESKRLNDKNKKVEMLEKAMKDDLQSKLQDRFIPYIQLHEFESLLFYDMSIFEKWIPENDILDKQNLTDTLKIYSNSELINDTNPPSYRLKHSIKGYDKVLCGSIFATEIGLENIKIRNPRFASWIEILLNLKPLS